MKNTDLLNNVHFMDCLDGHKLIPNSSVDLIYSDLPYNQTKNHWDELINLEKLWNDYKRIIKPNGAIVLHCQGAFTAMLMVSTSVKWRYNLIWKKGERVSGHLNAKKMPMRNHEDVAVFYKTLPTYNPQFTEGPPLHSKGKAYLEKEHTNNNYGEYHMTDDSRAGSTEKYPKSVLNFDRPHPPIHPTQKPIPLAEWVIKTYSNKNNIVLDSTVGIGTSVVACKNTNRQFIAFENDPKIYYDCLDFIKKHAILAS